MGVALSLLSGEWLAGVRGLSLPGVDVGVGMVSSAMEAAACDAYPRLASGRGQSKELPPLPPPALGDGDKDAVRAIARLPCLASAAACCCADDDVDVGGDHEDDDNDDDATTPPPPPIMLLLLLLLFTWEDGCIIPRSDTSPLGGGDGEDDDDDED